MRSQRPVWHGWQNPLHTRMHAHAHLFPCSQTWSGNPSTLSGPLPLPSFSPRTTCLVGQPHFVGGDIWLCSALDRGCSESALHPAPRTPHGGGSETGAEGAPWCEEGMGCLLLCPVPTNCAPPPLPPQSTFLKSGLCVSGCLELASCLEADSALPSRERRETS